MRRLVLLLALAGCPAPSGGGVCNIDEHCDPAEVCARTSECLPPSQVRLVRLTWTIRGQPANDTTCAQTPDLYVLFAASGLHDTLGYAPVPCRAGLFTVDKLPRRFVSAEIGVENRFSEVEAIDADGNVAFDLYP